MIFKNKYERSEWMEGFLEAEALYRDRDDGFTTEGIRSFLWSSDSERLYGVLDYCWFIDNLNARENK